MFINLPSRFSKKDIKYHGILEKDEGYTYVLSDISNKDKIIELKSDGFYSYVYTLCNTYLFIIGNCKGLEDINPNKINFLNKIMEYDATVLLNQVTDLNFEDENFNGTYRCENWRMNK